MPEVTPDTETIPLPEFQESDDSIIYYYPETSEE